jgi:hypothetical protein
MITQNLTSLLLIGEINDYKKKLAKANSFGNLLHTYWRVLRSDERGNEDIYLAPANIRRRSFCHWSIEATSIRNSLVPSNRFGNCGPKTEPSGHQWQ